jgi:uncharacterized protein
MRIWLFSFFSAAVLLAIPARAASFDCAKAHVADERAVCASRGLSEMDVEMAVRFDTMRGLVAMGTRGDMGDAQRGVPGVAPPVQQRRQMPYRALSQPHSGPEKPV